MDGRGRRQNRKFRSIKLGFYCLIRLWRPSGGAVLRGESIKLERKQLEFFRRFDKAK